MKKLLLFLFILLLISASSIAQITNLTVNGQNSNFTMASGDLLSWSYNVPFLGDTTYIEFWFDTDQNGILNPATDVLWSSLIQADGITNGGQNGIPDMDGTANGQVSLQVNVGLAPSYYVLVFKNHNAIQTINGTVTALASPAFTISGNVSVPSGISKQNIALTLQNKSNGGQGKFWNALTDINGDFAIQMDSDTSGNPWNLTIDNKDINNSFIVSPNHYSLNINPNSTAYTGNNFTITSGGLTNLTVNGSGTNFTMVSGDLLSWSYNVPVVGDSTFIEIWIDTDQNGSLNPASDILWSSFAQVDGATNIQNGLPDMDGTADGHVSFQQNVGLAPVHYIFVFKNHNDRKTVTGTVTALVSPAFTISGNVSVPEGISKQYIPMILQNNSTNGGNKFWNALTDNNGNFTIQMNSDTSGNPWNLGLDKSSGQNSFISTPAAYSLVINPNTAVYTGNNFVLTKGSMNKNIIVTSPNGGEVWKPGETKTIYWNMSGISSVKIEFSPDRGNNWSLIVGNTPSNQCYYNWTVPQVNSQDCFIKISDAADNSVNDISNNNFIIYQPVINSQFSGIGPNTLNFGETYIYLDLNVLNPDQITATLFTFEAPQPGILPTGITQCSGFYWTISTTGNLIFNNGFIKIPAAILQGVGDPTGFVWMKRTNPGEAWTNIGGTITDGNLVSTEPFNSFSEFALGTVDNALPVELSSFISVPNGRTVQLNWETKTERNSNKFVIERKTIDAAWGIIGTVKASVLSNSPKKYSYTDTKLQSGKYQFRLKMIDNDGSFSYSSITEAEVSLPTDYELSQNYPNPFNPSTKIDYKLPSDSKVTLEVFNLTGERVCQLVNENQAAGYYSVDLGASRLTSGVYFYKITATGKAIGNNFSAIKKMILLK
jgi:Secretion system C-terminal sorting domain